MQNSITKQRALYFIILLGMVSLFADMTYEGARSITGAYLAVLGANAAIVGFVAGFGELIGYGLRYVSGYFADKTQRYWFITALGYTINVLSVPLLALTNSWPLAAFLIVLERFGKSIRIPARDAMLARASQTVGMGFGFGLHQAFDQTGAMLGPLLVALVLFFSHQYKNGFAILVFPAFLALLTLYFAYRRYPNPHHLEMKTEKVKPQIPYSLFKLFLLGSVFVAAGFADFPLIAYHFQKTGLIINMWLPITYGIAMGVDAVTAPFLGRLYDRYGLIVLIVMVGLTAFFAPLVFLGNRTIAFIGVMLWGVGMGVQDSLLRSIIGHMITADKRARIFGLFNMVYGIAWFLGSFAQGLLYDYSLLLVVVFILILQLIAIPFFVIVDKKWNAISG